MKACFCVLAGTKTCETCNNNPRYEDKNTIFVGKVKVISSKYLRDGEYIIVNDGNIIDHGIGVEDEQKPS